MSPAEQQAYEAASKKELDESVAELKKDAVWFIAARRSGVQMMEMGSFERLVKACERYADAVQRRAEEWAARK